MILDPAKNPNAARPENEDRRVVLDLSLEEAAAVVMALGEWKFDQGGPDSRWALEDGVVAKVEKAIEVAR